MKQVYSLLVISFLLGLSTTGLAWQSDSLLVSPDGSSGKTKGSLQAAQNPLFDPEDLLRIKIVANFKAITQDRTENAPERPALLTYYDEAQKPVTLPIKLKVRGNFRRSRQNCIFPPLLLDFPKKQVQHTLFQDQNKLKLITHCQSEDYIIQEYLVYKAYNLLTTCSFKVRLAQVTYEDSAGRRSPEIRYAFLLEDEKSVASRNGMVADERKAIHMKRTDTEPMVRLAVFQYMIGNTDWSVPYRHNIRLFLANRQSLPVPVPYDFDHSGIVGTSYAKPAPELELPSVRDRLYRGYSYSAEVFQRVFREFDTIKPQLYALYRNSPYLNPGYVNRTIKYLDKFYAMIHNPARFQAEFLQRGKKNEQSYIVIKGLK